MKKGNYILIFGLCLLTACSNIQGTYVANHHVGADTVKLLVGNKWIRICYPPTSQNHYIDSGTWNVSRGTITFKNWHGRNKLDHASGEVIFITQIDRSFFIGEPRILIDDDMDYYYIKKETQ